MPQDNVNLSVLLFQCTHVEALEGGEFATDRFGVGVIRIESGECREWLAEVSEIREWLQVFERVGTGLPDL